jgi:type III secretory pathway component EscU
MLLWDAPFQEKDQGIRYAKSWFRVVALTAIFWVFANLIIIGVSVIPECGLEMCPDDPPNIAGVGDFSGWLVVLSVGVLALAFALAVVVNQKLSDVGEPADVE